MSSFELHKETYVCSFCGSTKMLVDSRDRINEYCDSCKRVRSHSRM